MSCKGCSEKQKNMSFDRRGNIIETEVNDMEKYEQQQKAIKDLPISYREFIEEKNKWAEQAGVARNNFVETLTADQKRIQIQELIGIANRDEVGGETKLSPSQAIVALWYIVHHHGYTDVVMEFKNLAQQVDEKYNQLQKEKIVTKWIP